MKWMIASDLHGSAKWCGRMLEMYEKEQPGRLILLGDLLYHGPRNDLPDEYAPKRVLEMLNDAAPHLLCVRGNCDGEVDQMVLTFPMMADYAALWLDGHMFYATHGHRFGEDCPPPLMPGDILLCGHTHVPGVHRHERFTYVNPGSTSIPKAGSAHSCCMLEGGVLSFYDLDTGAICARETLY